MKKLSLLLVILFLSACSPVDSVQVFDQKQAAALLHQQYQMHPTRQMIKLSLPNKKAWQRIDLSHGTIGSPIMLIPAHEHSDDWTQSIRTQIRGKRHDSEITAAKFVREIIAQAKQTCASAEAEILATNPSYAEYKLVRTGCPEQADQIQVGKAFNGSDAVYVVYYSALIAKISPRQIKQNIQIIKSAKLIKRPDALY